MMINYRVYWWNKQGWPAGLPDLPSTQQDKTHWFPHRLIRGCISNYWICQNSIGKTQIYKNKNLFQWFIIELDTNNVMSVSPGDEKELWLQYTTELLLNNFIMILRF